ncbi:glycosyltransferase family 4 protein [Ichthyenterobacterium magnum]|uniref:Glycosyltransferase involved in cell wall biosynthesis n=1 Tax=Ichthyenterobacterium magnum TaxID=1230530 RepID=A0A420DUQ0_9FLAO|nr:glycosyltransferase family 4 protein [Ichthyenterobacterium magnum]RKE97975.1 glycosyltransferase involved in cell wall biosynthesis [Ichthyenterobacterium magnum]
MTIAFLTSEYPHEKLKPSAGLGSSIKNLAKGLIKSGVDVTVFVVFQNENTSFIDENIKVISIARKGYTFFGWYLERKHIQGIVQQEINAANIEAIEAPDWTGITAFMNFTIPVVIRLHGSDAYFCHLEKRQQKKKHYFFENNALKRADKLLSVSAFTAQVTTAIFKLKKDIKVIHNGIDTTFFKPMEVEVNKGQLLYFGTIIRKKGVLELAQIFNFVVASDANASLLLIGKDVQDVLENKSTLSLFNSLLTPKAKEKVTHILEVPYKDVKDYIAKANVVVLPSFAEAFPMTWLEALAMEKALVSSNIGWAKELMVDKETGYTVDPAHHKAYADTIITLLRDCKKAKMFGKQAREHVILNFSNQVIIEQNISFYKALIKGKNEI